MSVAPAGDYPPIADYAVIGDCRSAALIAHLAYGAVLGGFYRLAG